MAASGFRPLPRNNFKKDTSDYIFDKNEVHNFAVDTAHFRAKNHSLHRSTVTTDPDAEAWIAESLVPTYGRIWDIIEYYFEGAVIHFQDKRTAETIYKRILDHFDAHLVAMRTDKMYDAPDVEDFRMMSEFATSIRSLVIDINPNIDVKVQHGGMNKFLPSRPTFSRTVEVKEQAEKDIPKSMVKMDIIERFMEMRYGS